MTKKQEVEYWRSKCQDVESGLISFQNGQFTIMIPPNIPGLKRLYKKAMKLHQFLEHHPMNKATFKKQ